MNEPQAETGYQQVLDETRRLLVNQEAKLDTLRGRATTMLTVAAVVAGLFAPRVSTHDDWRAVLLVVSLLLFAGTTGVVVLIHVPQSVVFAHDMTPWIERWKKGTDPSLRDLAYNLSRDFTDYHKANAPIIDRLQKAFTATCALVALQVLTWGVAAL